MTSSPVTSPTEPQPVAPATRPAAASQRCDAPPTEAPAAGAPDAEQQRVIEALLFSSESPVTLEQLREVLGAGSAADIRACIEALRASYRDTGHAFTIEEVAGGFQMATDPRFAPWIRKLYKEERSDRLSGAALETLAIVAYRQPLTRVEIEQIRGVNVDAVMQTLLEKGVIKILGRKEAPGRPLLYGTTKEFLQHFGLNSLTDLPSIEELAQRVPAPTSVAEAAAAGEAPVAASPAPADGAPNRCEAAEGRVAGPADEHAPSQP